MKTRILLFLMLWLSLESSAASGLIAEADSAYKGKDYFKAIELYQRVASEDGVSAALLYDMGNAYYQTNDYGNAMLCWLRARRLDPRMEELNANIRYLQSRVEDANKAEQKGKRLKVTPDEPGFFQSIRSSVGEDVPSDRWAVWGAVLFILFVGGAAVYMFTRNVALRKAGFFGGIVCFAVSVIFVSFAFMGARAASTRDKGVVTAYKVTLQTEAGKTAESAKNGILTKGTVVQILSEEVDAGGEVRWYKVRLNTDYIGWVAASDLEVV